MPDAYTQLLDATIQHLEKLKNQGVRNVAVSPQSLTALALGPPPPHPQPPSRTAPSIVRDKAAAFEELRPRAMVCVRCPHLAASRKQVVFGVGNIDSPLMF